MYVPGLEKVALEAVALDAGVGLQLYVIYDEGLTVTLAVGDGFVHVIVAVLEEIVADGTEASGVSVATLVA